MWTGSVWQACSTTARDRGEEKSGRVALGKRAAPQPRVQHHRPESQNRPVRVSPTRLRRTREAHCWNFQGARAGYGLSLAHTTVREKGSTMPKCSGCTSRVHAQPGPYGSCDRHTPTRCARPCAHGPARRRHASRRPRSSILKRSWRANPRWALALQFLVALLLQPSPPPVLCCNVQSVVAWLRGVVGGGCHRVCA